jgi:hypothetical protein
MKELFISDHTQHNPEGTGFYFIHLCQVSLITLFLAPFSWRPFSFSAHSIGAKLELLQRRFHDHRQKWQIYAILPKKVKLDLDFYFFLSFIVFNISFNSFFLLTRRDGNVVYTCDRQPIPLMHEQLSGRVRVISSWMYCAITQTFLSSWHHWRQLFCDGKRVI